MNTTTTNIAGEDMTLSKSEQDALRACAVHRPGFYVWKPATMKKLAAKGLTMQCASGAYQLTQAGADMIRALREQKQ
jgi:hypothetical protein